MQEMWETRVRYLGQEDPLEKEWQPIPDPCLGNPMDRGTWWASVHEASKSQLSTAQQHVLPLKKVDLGFPPYAPSFLNLPPTSPISSL